MSARNQILEVATRRMAERGVEATSLQAIADEVGIRKPSILYHFESKEALRRAVLEGLLARWNEVMPKLLMATSRDGIGRFEAVMRELIGFFTSDPNRARLLVRELMDRPDEMRPYVAKYVQPWLDVVANYIRKDQNAGHTRKDVDAEAYVLTVVCMTLGSLATVDDLGSVLKATESSTEPHTRWASEMIRMARISLFKENPDG
jgi:TetR/AcrR family transcriptional regulator